MKRLLIVKLSSLGDILHALPVVKSIKDDLPEVSIDWVVRERCLGLLQGCEFLDKVHVIKNSPGLADLFKLHKQMKEREYDTAFDMQGLFLSGVVAAISGAKRRVGLNRNRELNSLFLTDSTVEGKKKRHAVDILLGFREKAGLQIKTSLPVVTHLGESSRDWLTGSLAYHDGVDIVLNVGASTIYKRWPRDRWVELATLLLNEGFRLAVTAGPSETEDADAIVGEVPLGTRMWNLAGKTNQDQLASVFRTSKLVISGDTGPLHLAVAVGTPTVALFGPTNPDLTGPYGLNNSVVWKRIECSPCFRHPTCNGRVDCLKAISAQEVFDLAAARLRPRSLAGSSK